MNIFLYNVLPITIMYVKITIHVYNSITNTLSNDMRYQYLDCVDIDLVLIFVCINSLDQIKTKFRDENFQFDGISLYIKCIGR